MSKRVFITGGTGFMGRRLIEELVTRGYEVDALVRASSTSRLPSGCRAVVGDALDPTTYASRLTHGHVFVQLVGVSHPGPLKKNQFRSIDFAAGSAAVRAAASVPVKHFVYLSVAQPAPIMKAYVEARAEVEALIRLSGLNATIVRPWYVLGPGRWWPLLLQPFYWILEALPATREGAKRLGLVTHRQMTAALLHAVETAATGVNVYDVPTIRSFGR